MGAERLLVFPLPFPPSPASYYMSLSSSSNTSSYLHRLRWTSGSSVSTSLYMEHKLRILILYIYTRRPSTRRKNIYLPLLIRSAQHILVPHQTAGIHLGQNCLSDLHGENLFSGDRRRILSAWLWTKFASSSISDNLMEHDALDKSNMALCTGYSFSWNYI